MGLTRQSTHVFDIQVRSELQSAEAVKFRDDPLARPRMNRIMGQQVHKLMLYGPALLTSTTHDSVFRQSLDGSRDYATVELAGVLIVCTAVD
jgi:hypothetical protein